MLNRTIRGPSIPVGERKFAIVVRGCEARNLIPDFLEVIIVDPEEVRDLMHDRDL